MKWYFASNNQSPGYEYLIKAAVESAIKNTSLVPHFLYDGTPDKLTAWLEAKGVNVIYHRTSFYNHLKEFYPQEMLRTAAGAFLRCDIPLIEAEDDLVLYTDCDVLFVGEIIPQDIPRPELFACAPEVGQTNWAVLNTGAMLMNLPALRKTHRDFTEFIIGHLPELTTFDQTAYNRFYAGRHTPLPLEYNWKPYWGANPDAKIIHFHGPKPHHMVQIMTGVPVPDIYKPLFAMNRLGCIHYLSLFGKYSDNFPVDPSTALQLGGGFLAKALEEKEAELKAANKKLLWNRLKKNTGRLFRKKSV
jgi:hypothetical protein